jgi:predicted RNA-binding Zn ribbon-like protein
MKICPVGAKLIHVDEQRRHDEANRHFCDLFECVNTVYKRNSYVRAEKTGEDYITV